jgi:hypothetical protein
MAPRKTAAKRSTSSFLPVAGRWAFLAGMIVAIVFGLIPGESVTPIAQEWIGYILMALGLIAGYLHFNKERDGQFILLAIGLAIFGNSLGSIPTAGSYILGVITTLSFLFGVVVVGVVIRNVVGWFVEQF